MSFAKSVRKNVDIIISEIDAKMYAISSKLFKEVIHKCPVLRGNLINDFHVKANGYDYTSNTAGYIVGGESSEGPSSDKNGTDSLNRIALASKLNVWKAKDGFLSMSTSVPYAYQIEFLGWSKVKSPLGFVRNSLTEVAAEVRQGNVL